MMPLIVIEIILSVNPAFKVCFSLILSFSINEINPEPFTPLARRPYWSAAIPVAFADNDVVLAGSDAVLGFRKLQKVRNCKAGIGRKTVYIIIRCSLHIVPPLWLHQNSKNGHRLFLPVTELMVEL